MGKKKKKEEPKGPPGAPEWVVTFTDMISLLVTFFVLLMTFSSLDSHEVLKVDSLLDGSNGPMSSRGFMLAEMAENDFIAASDSRRGANRPHSRPPSMLTENLEEMGQKKDGREELDLKDVLDGLVIEFEEKASFASGSAVISTDLEKSLVEIGEVLQHYPHMVVVEGFTDGAFRPNERFDSADALSFARAEAAAKLLLDRTDMNPALLQIAAHGDRLPRADDVSPSGRRLNRRVQLRVLSLSKVRDSFLQTQETRRNG